MKKAFVISTLLLCVFTIHNAKAQDSSKNFIGIKGGLSIPNLTSSGGDNNPRSSGYQSKTGPDFAIFFDKGISKKFSLVTQLQYIAQGGKKDGGQAFPTPVDLAQYFTYIGQPVPVNTYATFNSEAKLNYLMLSELAKFTFPFSKSHLSFYAEAGPFAALLVSAHQVTSGSSTIYADAGMTQPIPQTDNTSFDNKEDIKDQLHKGNFGIEGDVGFALNFSHSKIFIEGGGNYGFLTIQKESENGKNHIGAGVIRIGYAFGFK